MHHIPIHFPSITAEMLCARATNDGECVQNLHIARIVLGRESHQSDIPRLVVHLMHSIIDALRVGNKWKSYKYNLSNTSSSRSSSDGGMGDGNTCDDFPSSRSPFDMCSSPVFGERALHTVHLRNGHKRMCARIKTH